MTKQEIRKEISRRKSVCTQKELVLLSAKVVDSLCKTTAWHDAKTVLLYHSLPDEVDTKRLIAQALEQGKRVLLPVVVGDDLELRETKGNDLHTGAFNIQEPTGEAFKDFDVIDLAIIPGVAFTSDGKRLGRGRGYYDRLLVRLTHTPRWGLCWPFQIVESLPTEAHDITMSRVISA